MAVKVPNQLHPLVISLDERQSPLAVRFFQQQLSRKAWHQASLLSATPDFIILGPADPHPLKLAKTRPQKFAQRGLVAFEADSDTNMIINLSGKSVPAGPILGKLTPNSFDLLTDAISKSRKRSAPPESEVAPKLAPRRRKLTIQSYDFPEPPSDQLERLKSFEKRLAGWQVSRKDSPSP